MINSKAWPRLLTPMRAGSWCLGGPIGFYHQVTKTPRKLWAAGSRERSAVLPFIYASESEGSSLFLRLVAHQSWVYTVGVQDAKMEILITGDQ